MRETQAGCEKRVGRMHRITGPEPKLVGTDRYKKTGSYPSVATLGRARKQHTQNARVYEGMQMTTPTCIILAGACLIAAFALGADGIEQAKPIDTAAKLTFTNPLKKNGADPWLTWHNGWYYMTTTTGHDIQMRRARDLEGLKSAEDRVVFDGKAPGRDQAFWATEFHRLKDPAGRWRWYGYYTAAGKDDPSHRMYVIQSRGDDPMGPYTLKGRIETDPKDMEYAIDGGPISLPDGRLYFVWCGRPSPHGQGLYISKMKNPWTTVGPRHPIEADGFGCDYVREGPVALLHGGKVFLVYSMCGASEPDYRLGMLVADDKADLSDPKVWKQHPAVVFARNDDAKVYGPGHNYFFKSPDGTQDWIVYHAKTTTDNTYSDRTARAQPFTWNQDGTPDFGKPRATDLPIEEPSGTDVPK